jgi:hypothetical protein
VLVTLLVRRDPRGIVLSLLVSAATVATAIWSIDQSLSSTAAIGFIVIPMFGALGGFLALAFGRYRTSTEFSRRIGAWVGLACALALVSYNIYGGRQQISKNRSRDKTQEAFSAEISRERDSITAALKLNPGHARAWLDSSIRTRMTDRAFLLAAIPNDSVSPDILDSLANSNDLWIALEALRNPNTRPETLERVYRTRSNAFRFSQVLAAHRHTPPAVMLELYRRPETSAYFDIWFAGNPATPREILDKISRTTIDRSVIEALLENPSLDCHMLSQLAVTTMKRQNRDADNPNVARVSQLVPKLCPSRTTP